MADVRQLLPALANDFRCWWPAEYWEASARKNCSPPLPAGATGLEALRRGKGRGASGSAAPVDLAGGVAREKLRRRRDRLVKQLVDVEQKLASPSRASEAASLSCLTFGEGSTEMTA